MKIAAHHIPGTLSHKVSSMLRSNPAYTPTCAWPENCTVQWGHGLVPAVPFFEAFMPGTFIRGEGEDIAAAEQKAFDQYSREFHCQHQWGRLRPGPRGTVYTNGAGWCRKCGAFRGSMFSQVVILGHMRKPLSRWEADWLEALEGPRNPEFEAHMERVAPGHAEGCRKEFHRLRVRRHLFGVEKSRSIS